MRRVPESQQDAVTALSGSGPAYFFYLVEAMVDAGILLGLPRALAADLIVQTALGAAVMMRDSGEHPVQLREAVTSPGGTTIAADPGAGAARGAGGADRGDRGGARPLGGARARTSLTRAEPLGRAERPVRRRAGHRNPHVDTAPALSVIGS